MFHLAACALRDGEYSRCLALLAGVERAPVFAEAMPDYAAESAIMASQTHALLGNATEARQWMDEAVSRLPDQAAAGVSVCRLFLLAREHRYHTAMDALSDVESVLESALDAIEWQRIQSIRAYCCSQTPEAREDPALVQGYLSGVTRRWTVPMAAYWPEFETFLDEFVPADSDSA